MGFHLRFGRAMVFNFVVLVVATLFITVDDVVVVIIGVVVIAVYIILVPVAIPVGISPFAAIRVGPLIGGFASYDEMSIQWMFVPFDKTSISGLRKDPS